jgi:hypothetical protein
MADVMSHDPMTSPALWTRVVNRWRAEKLTVRPGADAEAIASFERKYQVALPQDLRDYFTTVDGMDGNETDDKVYRFWQLGEVKPVEEELSDARGVVYPDRFAYPGCFVFADYCMNCWDYAVKLTDDPGQSAPVYRVTASDVPGEQMAPSFREFMERYAADPKSII